MEPWLFLLLLWKSNFTNKTKSSSKVFEYYDNGSLYNLNGHSFCFFLSFCLVFSVLSFQMQAEDAAFVLRLDIQDHKRKKTNKSRSCIIASPFPLQRTTSWPRRCTEGFGEPSLPNSPVDVPALKGSVDYFQRTRRTHTDDGSEKVCKSHMVRR